MPSSLRRALSDAGFTDVRIDEEVHDAAYVVDARRGVAPVDVAAHADVVAYVSEARRFARFWSAANDAVAVFERDTGRGRKSAIYGSGFYGVFIASRLADRSNLAYFLDRNPHQQAKRIFDRPVLAPEAIEDDVEVVYVGLNPAQAAGIAAGVAPLHTRGRAFFFI
jgi:FlaA1/EpsC-like NDP-sugar epimerase